MYGLYSVHHSRGPSRVKHKVSGGIFSRTARWNVAADGSGSAFTAFCIAHSSVSSMLRSTLSFVCCR